MIKAAGIMIVVGETALFLRRGNGSDHPNEWCIPGGQLHEGETAEAGAIRETFEETGFDLKEQDLKPWTRTLAPAETILEQALVALPAEPDAAPAPSEDVDFTTFTVKVNRQATPTLALDEHDGFAWAPITAPPQPLHPGVQVALDRFSMNELDISRAIADGRLTSPQRYENVWLFAIRITGTGVSYRHARQEYVWRDPSIYINEEFLARCNGLSVIWEHPEKSLLNDKEFKDRVIGSILLPYIPADKPDEVWGIAKIYDTEAALEMRDNQVSTSPAVNFADPSVNDRVTLEDGKIMLIEGKPSLLDHIAICNNGVWDKGGDPTGVESIDAAADSQPSANIGRSQTPKPNQSLDLLRVTAATMALKSRLSNRNNRS